MVLRETTNRQPGLVELHHEKAAALTRQFRDTLEFIHQILADFPQNREKVVKHAKRLRGFGKESNLSKDLALLNEQFFTMFKLSLLVPPGFFMELTVTPRRFNAEDLRDSGYVTKPVTADSVRHCVNVGLPHQEGNLVKQLIFDADLPPGGFPRFVLREVINGNKGVGRFLGADDLLGVKVRFPTR